MIQVTIGQAGGGFLSPPIIAAMISGLIALTTATVVGLIALRQWQTAKDKLALDLFDRRFKAWTDVEHCFQNALNDANDQYLRRQTIRFSDKTYIDFSRIESNAYWLFGDAVRAQIDRVARSITEMTGEQVDPDTETEGPDWESHFQMLSFGSVKELATLRKMVEPYMMLDKIAVNRPAKS